jgi:hypothetical protein
MTNNRSKLSALLHWRNLIFVLPLFALWSVPIRRAASFLHQAKGVYGEEQSLNAASDVSYGTFLLVAYAVCLLIQASLCLLLARDKTPLLLALLCLPIWALIQIIRFQPEEVIVLIPSLNPVWLFIWNGPTLIALFFFGLGWLITKKHGIPRTNQIAH